MSRERAQMDIRVSQIIIILDKRDLAIAASEIDKEMYLIFLENVKVKYITYRNYMNRSFHQFIISIEGFIYLWCGYLVSPGEGI